MNTNLANTLEHDTGVPPDEARVGFWASLREHPEWIAVPLLFVIVAGGWELAFHLLQVPPYIAPAPSAIWWRQLVPSATIRVCASAARTAGSSAASAIFIETS